MGEAMSLMDDVVFLSPITPARDGPGLAMRAAQLVRALGAGRRVHLRVAPLQDLRPRRRPPRAEDGLASTAHVWREPGPLRRLRHRSEHERARFAARLVPELCDSLRGIEPSAIVVFRHYLAPLAFELLARHPSARLVLDLDELESSTRSRLAALHEQRGERRAAAALRRSAARYRDRERDELSRADRLWVCSPAEAHRVAAATGLAAAVVPNVVDVPATHPPARPPAHAPARTPAAPQPAGAPATLLFIGSLGYAANLDAVEWLAREVLPLLDSRCAGAEAPLCSVPPVSAVSLRVVGAAPRAARRALRRCPGVALAGPVSVEALRGEYARASVAVVPLRAGGGTRIKLLEALAHRRPVVSTTLGAEGLELEAGRHLRIADDPRSFAAACAELLADPERAEDLAGHGYRRVRDAYGPAALERAVEAAFGERAA